jgi:hypothetical protein
VIPINRSNHSLSLGTSSMQILSRPAKLPDIASLFTTDAYGQNTYTTIKTNGDSSATRERRRRRYLA